MQLLLWALNLLGMGGAQEGLSVVAHPDYNLVYVEESTFLAGQNLPLKWYLTRKDGASCAVPTGGSIKVYDADDVLLSTLTPDLESDVPALTQVLAALWAVPATVGTYAVQISLTIGTDSQIRSDREIVVVR